MKIDPVLKKETIYMTIGSAICSAIMAVVFIAVGKFDYTVLIGLVLGMILSVGNYFLMGLTITMAMEHEETEAKRKMKSSYVARSVIMLVIMAGSIVLDFVNWIPVVASVFYPRIVIMVRGIYISLHEKSTGEVVHTDVGREIIEGEEMAESGDYGTVDEFEKFVGGFARSSTVREIEKIEKSAGEGGGKNTSSDTEAESTPKDVK